jgi:hypothetical protein
MSEVVTLAPPGAGIPWHNQLAGRFMMWRLPHRMDEAAALRLFDAEATKLLALTRGLTPAELAERVLVPPQTGLDDSSRYWSIAMTLEHVVIVGDAMANVVVELSHGRVPPGAVSTAAVKPRGEQGANEALAAYEAFIPRYVQTVSGRQSPLPRSPRYRHPWFGEITAHQWLCLAAIHTRIHRKQAEAIRARLGQPGPRVIETV